MTPVLEPPVLLCPSWNAALPICFANPPATVYLIFWGVWLPTGRQEEVSPQPGGAAQVSLFT